MAAFIEFMRIALYWAVVLCGTGYLTAQVFRLVDAIERSKRRNHRRARV